MNTDSDIKFVQHLVGRLAAEGFFGELTIRYHKGRITVVRREESLPLPSFNDEKFSQGEKQNEQLGNS